MIITTAALASWPRLHSFSIGLENSPDLLAARKVAHFIGTVHHEFVFTVQEGLDAIPEVIYHLETFDVTTVRASTPMYLLSRKIKATGVKMVLSGEGSDEIFGGYLYFHAAPGSKSFHQECVKRVKNLHTADCLRANKSVVHTDCPRSPNHLSVIGLPWLGVLRLGFRSLIKRFSRLL